ncbi:MAG: addiction module protein [Sulfurimicrobium sp.]|nr:addiction module protein [Sulfurimicrobium sp.]
MNARVEAMMEQVKVLTAEERVALLDALNEFVSPPDSEWETAWAKECEDRLDAYERGGIEAEDFDVVMARMRREFLAK